MLSIFILSLLIRIIQSQTIIYDDLSFPSGIGIDSQNYIYVANTYGDNIVKIDTSGQLSKIYPSIPPWSNPTSIAVDNAGNMYIAYMSTREIVQTDAYGNLLSNLSINSPKDVITDDSGIYILDNTNRSIFKWGKTQTFTTDLSLPKGMKVDSSGNIYVVDSGNNCVFRLNYLGQKINTYTSGFNAPSDIFLDGYGNMYIADSGNARVVKLNSNGQLLASYTHNLPNPVSLAVDDSGIYVTNIGEINVAVKISFGQRFTDGSNFLEPTRVTVDSRGNVYVLDRGSYRIVKLDIDGSELLNIGFYPRQCEGIAIDSHDHLYVTITGESAIMKYDGFDGNLLTILPSRVPLVGPTRITTDLSGLYLVDGGDRIVKVGKNQKFYDTTWFTIYLAADGLGNLYIYMLDPYYQTPTIVKLDYLGNEVNRFSVDAAVSGIAADSLGYVYVLYSNYIVKYTSSGTFVDLLSSNLMNLAVSIAVASSGNIYVIDSLWTCTIIRFGSDGKQDTSFPTGVDKCTNVAVDLSENIYVASYAYNEVVKLDSSGSIVASFSFNNVYVVAVGTDGNFYINYGGTSIIAVYDSNGNYKTAYTYEDLNHVINIGFSIDPTAIYVTASGEELQQNYVVKINCDRVLLNQPNLLYVAVDAYQYVYVTQEYTGGIITKIDNFGNIVGTFSDSLVIEPAGLTVDTDGYIYIMDRYTGAIVKLDSQGNQVSVWHDKYLNNPQDIAVNPSGIYIVNTDDHLVLKIPVFQVFASLVKPTSIAIHSRGIIYIADSASSKIVKFDYDGKQLDVFTSIVNPTNIVIQGDSLYVTDAVNSQVAILDAITGDTLWQTNIISQPQSAGADGTGIYIIDGSNQHLVKINFNQTYTAENSLALPVGIAVDSNQFMYIADTNLKAIIKLDHLGNKVDVFEVNVSGPLGGITVDNNYNIYVTALRENRLLGFDQYGNVILNTTSYLNSPIGVATDTNGNVYVVNSGNSSIVKY